MVVATTRDEPFPAGAEDRLDYFAEIAGIAIGTAEANERLARLAMSDALTGTSAEARKTPVMWLRPPARGGRERKTPGELAIRDRDWKLLVAGDGSQPELFDVIKDPNEQTNIADKNPDAVKRLTDAVLAWDRSIESKTQAAHANR